MSADDSFPMDQISSLFPQLENIQLVGAKGPQQIFTATLKSNFAPVMLRVVPTEEAGIFGWDPEFIVRSLTIVEQSHQGLLRVYEVGQAGPFTFIISEHPPYPRMADMETLPQISPQAALNLVRNMAEGLLTLHRKNIFHGGITPKLICLREDGGDALLLPINIYPAQPPVDMGDFASGVGHRSGNHVHAGHGYLRTGAGALHSAYPQNADGSGLCHALLTNQMQRCRGFGSLPRHQSGYPGTLPGPGGFHHGSG